MFFFFLLLLLSLNPLQECLLLVAQVYNKFLTHPHTLLHILTLIHETNPRAKIQRSKHAGRLHICKFQPHFPWAPFYWLSSCNDEAYFTSVAGGVISCSGGGGVCV